MVSFTSLNSQLVPIFDTQPDRRLSLVLYTLLIIETIIKLIFVFLGVLEQQGKRTLDDIAMIV